MKLLFSEAVPDPAHYVYPFAVWGFLEKGETPATAFAAFTFLNIAPRGAQHHAWYKAQFKDYPAGRRAVIPFVW